MNAAEAPLHLRLAREGMALAVAGTHDEALQRYREAMRLAQEAGAPAVVVRHYAWCAMESLERAGHHAGVLALCEQVEAVYAARPPETPAGRKDLAGHLERKGVALWKLGRRDEALAALTRAARVDPAARVAAQLARWLAGGLTVPPARLAAEQDRHRYWSVRPDTVPPAAEPPR